MTTSEEHRDAGGMFCPVCSADDVQGGPVEITGEGALQECSCSMCDATWSDEYQLVGYTDLDVGGES